MKKRYTIEIVYMGVLLKKQKYADLTLLLSHINKWVEHMEYDTTVSIYHEDESGKITLIQYFRVR